MIVSFSLDFAKPQGLFSDTFAAKSGDRKKKQIDTQAETCNIKLS